MPESLIDASQVTATHRTRAPLTIFVHRASECLTDHLPHGDGLICYSLLSELARRGHRIIAFTNRDGVQNLPALLDVREQSYKVPANSLGDWELGIRANQLLKKIQRTESVDIVWRMHPYDASSPIVPYTNGRPLVIGPLFYGWPAASQPANDLGRPRLGIGIRGIVSPWAKSGWLRSLRRAALVLCATDALSDQTRRLTDGLVQTLPVIVDPPADLTSSRDREKLQLVFAANLYRNKNPLLFCQIIQRLRAVGILVCGEILGDGPERIAMQQWCETNNLTDAIRFLGKVPNTTVYKHLVEADGLVSTSFGEPYGRSIAEAMSMGTVPICHRSGGPADFILHGTDGLLIDRIEAGDYADAIAHAWHDPAAWKRLSAAALRKARQWTTDVVVSQLENVLWDLPRKQTAR